MSLWSCSCHYFIFSCIFSSSLHYLKNILMFSLNEQFYFPPSLYHYINCFFFAWLFLTGYLAGGRRTGSSYLTFLYIWLKSYLLGFGWLVLICCCFLTNVNCVVSTGVRINQNNFLFCFSFPLGSQCSAVVLLKFLCANREPCIIAGDDAWEGKTVESFRSAEFEVVKYPIVSNVHNFFEVYNWKTNHEAPRGHVQSLGRIE